MKFLEVENCVVHLGTLEIVPQISTINSTTYFNLTATVHKKDKKEHKVVTALLTSPYKEVLDVVKEALVNYGKVIAPVDYIPFEENKDENSN